MQIEHSKQIFIDALNEIGINNPPDIKFETPKNPEHGDLSTNIAMQLAGTMKKAPRAIAQQIIETLQYDNDIIEEVSIAGPGFINLKFSDNFYAYALGKLAESGDDFGRSAMGKGQRVNVEYVSVNPTGLLHLGHGRNAVIGDTVASLYEWCGYDVTREYYFNNAGNQMNNLAKSIYARYMQQVADPGFEFPEDGYHGDYIKSIASDLIATHRGTLKEGTYQDLTKIRKFGENWCFEKIKQTLTRIYINQDVFYNEDSLYKSGKIKELIDELTEKGLAYDKDGAKWLRFSELGLNDDRVIVKSSGEPTYRLPDIAYHREKFRRGFDIIVDVFGSDHVATIPDVLAAIQALGFDKDKVKVLIHQFVTLTENGQQVKMSKRTGKSYTLDDLLDEVGEDVVRFFLLMRGISTHLEFDLAIARQQSDTNPVFYLQYAHARICSVFDQAKERGITVRDSQDLTLLKHESEINLIKLLIRFPEIIVLACNKSEPHVLADYLRELAAAFHIFYHNCRIICSGENLMQARFQLAGTTRTAMRNGLTILGISAPVRM